MDAFHDEANALFELYWEKRGEVEGQMDLDEESWLDERKATAESFLEPFQRLERASQSGATNATTLLVYQLGSMIYGDLGDNETSLEYLRALIRESPPEGPNAEFAIRLTVGVHETNPVELAKTLSLIKVDGLKAWDRKMIRTAVFNAMVAYCASDVDFIDDGLLALVGRVCGLDVAGVSSYVEFFGAYRAAFGPGRKSRTK